MAALAQVFLVVPLCAAAFAPRSGPPRYMRPGVFAALRDQGEGFLERAASARPLRGAFYGMSAEASAVVLYICAGVALALLIAVGAMALWWCSRRLRRPKSQAPVDSEVSADPELAEKAMADQPRPGTLEGDLADLRQEQLRVLVETAATRRKLQDVKQGIAEVQERIRLRDRPSSEELAKRADEIFQAGGTIAEKKIAKVLAIAGPVVMQGKKVFEVWERRVSSLKSKTLDLALAETMGFVEEVKDIFDVANLEERISSFLDRMDLTTVATIVASALAPMQLKLIYTWNWLMLLKTFFFTALSICVLVADSQLCDAPDDVRLGKITPRQLYAWFLVDAVIGLQCAAVRLKSHIQLRGPVLALERRPPPVDVAHCKTVQGILDLLDYYVTSGLEALQALDAVLRSWWRVVEYCTDTFVLLWLCYGCVLAFGASNRQCFQAGTYVLRFRVAFFLSMLYPNLLALLVFCLTHACPKRVWHVFILSNALKADEFLQLGIPVALLLSQALLVRNWQDMVGLQIRLYQLKKAELKAEQRDAQVSLDRATQALRRNQSRIKSLRKVEGKARKHPQGERRRQAAVEKEEILRDAEAVLASFNAHVSEATAVVEHQVRQIRDGHVTVESCQRQAEVYAAAARTAYHERVEPAATAAAAAAGERLRDAYKQNLEPSANQALGAARTAYQEKVEPMATAAAAVAGKRLRDAYRQTMEPSAKEAMGLARQACKQHLAPAAAELADVARENYRQHKAAVAAGEAEAEGGARVPGMSFEAPEEAESPLLEGAAEEQVAVPLVPGSFSSSSGSRFGAVPAQEGPPSARSTSSSSAADAANPGGGAGAGGDANASCVSPGEPPATG